MNKAKTTKQGIAAGIAAAIVYGAVAAAFQTNAAPALDLASAAKNKIAEAFCQAVAAMGGVL